MTITYTGGGGPCHVTAVNFDGNFPAYTDNGSTITTVAPAGSGVADVSLFGGQGGSNPVSFTYTSGSVSSSDSQKLQALQNGVTKSTATVSGQTITSQIDGAIANAFSDGGAPVAPSANGVTFNFAAEPKSDVQARTEEAFSALAYGGNVYKAPVFKAAPQAPYREWSAWLDLRGTGFENNTTNADLKGSQYNVTGGIGRKLTPNLLIGIVGGYEHMKYDSAALAGTIKGDGGSIGGYLGWRIMPTLRFDAALTYGHIDYSAVAGLASGSFAGNRFVASGGLTGFHQYGAFTLEPSARVYALWEKQDAWTDSLGTLQAQRNFSAGMASAGGKVLRPWISGDLKVAPYAGFYGDYRFSSDNALPAGTTTLVGIGDGWSGRITSGLTFTNKRGASIAFGGEYGGLGAAYKVWIGNIRGTVPF